MIPSVLLAAEYTLDKNNRGVGLVANMTHEAAIPHWLTLRWNGVFSDAGSTYAIGADDGFGLAGTCGASDCDFHTFTVAVGAEFVEGLATVVEYKKSMLEGDGPPKVNNDVDSVIVQWVYTF